MIVAGIHLPDDDTHFGPLLQASERVDGKGTYQLGKLRRAVALVKYRVHAVDVGAQVGLWTRVLAREFQRVTAFEPVREFADCLEANCAECGNVQLQRHALGRENEIVLIHTGNDVATAYIEEIGARIVSGLVMMMYRLDDLCAPPIDFLKIDAEGYEAAILQGAEKTIRRDKPVIAIEQKRKRMARYGFKPEAGVDLLRSWGAEVAWEDHGDWCLQWPV